MFLTVYNDIPHAEYRSVLGFLPDRVGSWRVAQRRNRWLLDCRPASELCCGAIPSDPQGWIR
jgi:hypothetical protein